MRKRPITLRADAQKRKTMTAIATINSLEVHQWQTAHIKEGLRQADAGEFARNSEVTSAFSRRRK